MLPPDHPARFVLANEVHARPPERVGTPCRASYVALLVDADGRGAESARIAALCERHGVAPPGPGLTHFAEQLGPVRFKWERHGEFSGFMLIAPGSRERPLAETAAALLPSGWLASLPGRTVAAAHAELGVAGPEPLDAAELAAAFDGNVVVGGEIGGGAGLAYTDFRIHGDGFGRFVVRHRGLTELQAGQTLQRLFEIEAYRMMALLALPVAREQAPRIAAIEQALAGLTARIANGGGKDDDETLLHELTRLAAEVESHLSTSQFRFGACRAYHELVTTRIHELRESRLPGLQPIEEFMARRLTPAVATCNTASGRLHGLSERVAQASALLSTRVDIASERQNQALLASMDRRAKLQLRLQQTVEGLSVAAIVYYVAGLLGYLAKAGKAAGLPLETDLVVGLAVPVMVIAVLMALRRARRQLHQTDASEAAAG